MADPQGKGIHVLVAEDEPLAAEALADALERGGYRVTVARDGLQALACVAHQAPDVLIADLRMPGLSGTDMIRTMRLARERLPVVIVTGNPEVWTTTASEDEQRAVTVLSKPVSPRAILDAVAHALA